MTSLGLFVLLTLVIGPLLCCIGCIAAHLIVDYAKKEAK